MIGAQGIGDGLANVDGDWHEIGLISLVDVRHGNFECLVLPYGSQLAAMLYQAYSAGTITNPMATITAITLRVAWRTSRAKIFQMSFIVHLPVRGLCR